MSETFEPVLLSSITVSHNPRTSLRGVLEKFHVEGRADLPETSRQVFVSYMKETFPDIESLRVSIETLGLLQPPSIRAFRVKQGEEYVQRYGIVLGEQRILSYAIKEAMTGVPQTVFCHIEKRLSVDEAFERGLAENLDRHEMTPLDLAEAFHEMLHVRINPATKEKGGKGRHYTLQEVADRVRKSYWWVRDHEAIFYLPDNLKTRLVKDYKEGKRNVTKYCKLGLQHKAQATGQPEEQVGVDNTTTKLENVTAEVPPVEAKPEENVVVTEPKKRRSVLSLKSVQGLFDQTPLDNRERLLALAEVMSLSLEDSLAEREIREGQKALKE